jgi:hypothetical protein
MRENSYPLSLSLSLSLNLSLIRHVHTLYLLIILSCNIEYSEKMLPSEIVVRDGKRGNAPRRGDSCTVTLSLAKIVVSTT